MSVISRLFARRETSPSTPNNERGSGWVLNKDGWPVMMGAPTAAKIHVDEDKALTLSSVFRAVSVISQSISPLPWHVFEMQGDRRVMRRDHPADLLLWKRPNPETPPSIFRETLLSHALTWGNGYAEIERGRDASPLALWQIEPHRVQVKRDSNGEIYYEIRNDSGQKVNELPAASMFHLRGLGYDGMVGYSPVRLARESIASGLALERFGNAFFGNGANLGGVLEVPGSLKQDEKEALAKGFSKMYSGTNNAHKTAILDGGAKYTSIGIPPEDAQFLESRRFNVEEIARWYGVPPHKLANLDRATFSNIEHQAQEFVNDALVVWVTRLEQEANIKLFGGDDELYTRINLNALLRGDAKSRSEHYKNLHAAGALSSNDIRALEDMDGIGPDGDQYFVPMNMITLENARDNKGKADSSASSKENP